MNAKNLEDEALENIKEEYGFEEIKNAFDEASVPEQLEFFYGGNNENFVRACNVLSFNKETMNLSLSFAQTMDKISWRATAFPYTLNLGIFFMKISTQMKISTAFFWYNKTRQKQ